MIFCKDNEQSVSRIMEAIRCFSETAGLSANQEKSSMFVAGVSESVKTSLLGITGFGN